MTDLWTALVLGVVGGLHCAGMCGPLALVLPVPPGGRARFLAGRLLYNLGRIVTYAGLGLVFGLVGRTLLLAGLQRWLSIGLGLVLVVGLFASRRLAMARPVTAAVARLQRAMAGFLRQRSLAALGVLGLLNGLLPCGLVYVACLAAAATGHLITAALYMVAFGLGTVPIMLAMSLSGQLVSPVIRQRLIRLIPVTVVMLASLLILRGLGLGIPYLSPDLASAHASCCHRGP